MCAYIFAALVCIVYMNVARHYKNMVIKKKVNVIKKEIKDVARPLSFMSPIISSRLHFLSGTQL